MAERTRPALILHTSGVVNIDREFPVDHLESIHATVGGCFEVVPILNRMQLDAMCDALQVDLGNCLMLVQEDARLQQPPPPPNMRATMLAGQVVLGDVLLIDPSGDGVQGRRT